MRDHDAKPAFHIWQDQPATQQISTGGSLARFRSIERRSVVCQGEANASRSVRWRCVTEEAPRVKEVVTPASESRHVAEHHIGRRACGGTAGGDEQGGAAGAAALIPVHRTCETSSDALVM